MKRILIIIFLMISFYTYSYEIVKVKIDSTLPLQGSLLIYDDIDEKFGVYIFNLNLDSEMAWNIAKKSNYVPLEDAKKCFPKEKLNKENYGY